MITTFMATNLLHTTLSYVGCARPWTLQEIMVCGSIIVYCTGAHASEACVQGTLKSECSYVCLVVAKGAGQSSCMLVPLRTCLISIHTRLLAAATAYIVCSMSGLLRNCSAVQLGRETDAAACGRTAMLAYSALLEPSKLSMAGNNGQF